MIRRMAAVGAALLAGLLLCGCPGGEHNKEGAAPVTTSAAAGGGAVEISGAPHIKSNLLMYYERSAEDWIREARDATNKISGNDGRISADFRGSRDGKQAILYGKDAGVAFTPNSRNSPIIWNPADTYWAYKLNQDWKDPKVPNRANKGNADRDAVGAPQTILGSRFALAMWNDRADAFEKTLATPKYQEKPWMLLHDLATQGWEVTGNPKWGKLKMAQSDPTRSNSGMLALRLMFGEWQRDHAGAKPEDAAFIAWMGDIERAVVAGFQETTGNSLEAMLSGGRDKCDAAVIYEQNVLGKADSGEERIRLVYPTPTVAVEFPAMVVQADWVTAQQADDARAFIAFLQSEPMQKSAVAKGFRPAKEGADTANLATPTRTKAGFKADAATDDKPVAPETLDSLLYLWQQQFGLKTAAAPTK